MKKIIIILSCIFSSYFIYAQQVSQDEAMNAALNTLLYQTRNSELSRQDVDTVYTKVHNDNVILYEVHFRTGESVLLSGHKACKPVLGYTFKGNDLPTECVLCGQPIPEGLEFFVENYALQVDSCFQKNEYPYYQQEWEELQIFDKNRSIKSVNQISPLLSTKWGQTFSNDGCLNAYNYSIPGCSIYLHCPAGCAAVAMGQIMKKWNFPESIPSTCKVYDWNFMPDSLMCNNNNPQYYSQCQVVSQFLYDCGISINTNYCGYDCDEFQSYASPSYVPAAFNYFGYDNEGIIFKNNYSQAEWDSILIQDLLNGYPIFYSGSGNQGGHGFVCDGYDGNGLFHFNWGWRGSYNNSYYYTGNLSVGDYNFSNNQSIVYNIHPKECWDNIIMECDMVIRRFGVSLNAENLFSNNNHLFIIKENTAAHLQAGNEILLNDGFYAEEWSNVTIDIAPCSSRDVNQLEFIPENNTETLQNQNIESVKLFQDNHSDIESNGMLIFPNPTNQSFTISFTETQESVKQLCIFDLQGKIMLRQENLSSNTINISNLPSGTYIVQVISKSGKEYASKLVKE